MAYTPIGNKTSGGYSPIGNKTSGGYTPIGNRGKAPSPSLESFFPATNKVASISSPSYVPYKPIQTSQQKLEKVASDKSQGVTLSQGQPEKLSPLRKAVRSTPGDSRFERSLEQDFIEPIAKVGRFLFPSEQDYLREATEENPKSSTEEIKARARELMTSDGFTPLSKDTGGPTFSMADSMFMGRAKVGTIGKVALKRIYRKIVGATTEEAASKVARELTTDADQAKRFMDEILKANNTKAAEKVVAKLETKAAQVSKYTPVGAKTPDTGLLRDSFVKRFESLKPIRTTGKLGDGDVLRTTPTPKIIDDIKKTTNPTVTQLNEALEAIRVSGRKVDDLALELKKFTDELPAPYTQRAGASDIVKRADDYVDSLTTKASKYKTADEFVKAQGTPVYHSGSFSGEIDFKKTNFGDAFFVSDNKSYASAYGGKNAKMTEMVLSPHATLLDTTDPKQLGIVKEIKKTIEGTPTGKTQKIQKPDGSFIELETTPEDAISFYPYSNKKVIEGLEQGNPVFWEHPETQKILKDYEFDGLITQESKLGKNIAVFNPDALQTRSQLEDIWKKANQKPKGIFASAVDNLMDPARRQGGHIGGVPEGFPKRVRKSLSSTKSTTDDVINGAMDKYKANASRPVTPDNELAAAAKKTSVEGIKKLTGEILTPISSRLFRINPKLEVQVRKLEHSVASNTHRGNVEVKPLLDATKKMSAKDQAVFDLARKNGDDEVIDAIATRYDIHDELNRARDVMDDIYTRGNEVGMDIPYRGNFFPRMIINPHKFLVYLRNKPEWNPLVQLIEDTAAKKGVKYSDLDPEELSGMVNNFLRGYGNKIQLARPSSVKGRTIEVLDGELNEFYESSDSALATYITRMNDEIEGRKFFGKQSKGEDISAADGIGNYVLDLVQKGEIDGSQLEEVAKILQSRFHRGKMNGMVDIYRNVEYISTMGSPISALTQIGDISWSLFDNGWWNTAKGIAKSLSGKGITKEDLGIEQIIQEYMKETKSGKALETTFKWTGLSKMDRIGKETLVNGNMMKLQKWAKKGDSRLDTELSRWFDAEEAQVVKEQFRQGALTEDTKLVLFSRLLDFQPVAKSEMPQKYLEMTNGKIFYMLKSFTIKQYDIFRRVAIDDMIEGAKTGNVKQAAKGMKNLVHIAGLFVLANATADEIKDLVLGRDTPPSDRVVDNIFRLLGASKYDVYKARQEGFGSTVMKKILFPASVLDRSSKDAENAITQKTYEKGPLKGEKYESELVQSLPIGGKLYYWWFGRGAQKQEYKEGTGEPKSEGGFPARQSSGVEAPSFPKRSK